MLDKVFVRTKINTCGKSPKWSFFNSACKPSAYAMMLLSLYCLPAGATPTSQSNHQAIYVYTANQIGNDVSAYSIDAQGKLRPVPGSPYKAGSFPVSIAHSPDNRFVYIVNQGTGTISAYRIHAENGSLMGVPGSPFATPFHHPDAITVSPDGRHAYVTNEDGNAVMGYHINPDNGKLTLIDNFSVPTGDHPISIAVTPDNRFAYVTNFNDNTVSAYSVDAGNGRMKAIGKAFTTDEHPIHIAISADSKLLYVANYGSTTVSAFRINAQNGTLTEIEGSPYFAGAQPYSVVISPDSAYLYSANWGSHDSSAFRIDSHTGKLTELPEFRFKSGWYPYDIVASEDGLYVANNGESTVSAYHRDGKGELNQLAPPLASDLGPYSMTLVELPSHHLGATKK
jgi:6-phosphogluconolactonase